MSRYILSPDGTIKDKNNLERQVSFNEVLPKIGNSAKDNKLSENINRFFATADILPDIYSNDNPNSKKYIINESPELVNKSFNFINSDFSNKSDQQFENVKYYKEYTSVFDLELNSDETGSQLFAHELDFHGFTNDILRNPIEAVEEIILRTITIIDMTIAAAIPIITISILQSILQESISLKDDDAKKIFINTAQNFEFGKYITYRKLASDNNLQIILLEKTLNSFERLMNFPSFKFEGYKPLTNIFYFLIGYISYLTPGLKINFPANLNNVTTFISDIIITIISANSSRHIFNLLMRKIIKNNYFLKSYLDSPSINVDSFQYSLIRGLSILGSFFFRFIGERIGVGEKIFRIEYPLRNNQNNNFFLSRYGDLNIKDNKDTENQLQINKNNLLTSFRMPINNNISITSIFSQINKNTKSLYEGDVGKNRLKRIDQQTQKTLEASIDSEYMPFSIHDLRTNEVFSFHAFLENVSDSFSPNFTTSTGYGRMDPVKIYENTTRSINVDFWLISTSPEDHDYMWYYINRLVSCIYPQWSKPELANIENTKQIDLKFGNPFTQIPVAPPMIRLRVGDLFKSNYTPSNLVRQFEITNSEIIVNQSYNFETEFNSFSSITDLSYLKEEEVNNKINEVKAFLSKYNFKFLSDIGNDIYTSMNLNNKNIQNIEKIVNIIPKIIKNEQNWEKIKITIAGSDRLIPTNLSIDLLISNNMSVLLNRGETSKDSQLNSIQIEKIEENDLFQLIVKNNKISIQKISDKNTADVNNSNYDNILKQIKNKDINCYSFYKITINYGDDLNNTNSTNNNSKISFYMYNDYYTNYMKNKAIEIASIYIYRNNADEFLKSEKNVIKDSYEKTMGEGIAGFIKNLNVGIDNNVLWDIEKNKIAPMAVKIGLQFDPIHDIPLGLDYKGIMRSGAYSVGKINNELFKDKVKDRSDYTYKTRIKFGEN